MSLQNAASTSDRRIRNANNTIPCFQEDNADGHNRASIADQWFPVGAKIFLKSTDRAAEVNHNADAVRLELQAVLGYLCSIKRVVYDAAHKRLVHNPLLKSNASALRFWTLLRGLGEEVLHAVARSMLLLSNNVLYV